MKILFFSDIHGITRNLSYIESLISKENFDKIIVLGDLYYSGPNYKGEYTTKALEVKEFLTRYQNKIFCVRGNCDSEVDIKASDFPISDDMILLNVGGINIYCTHGDKYNFENSKKFCQNGVLIYGHEHIPYIKKNDEIIYICVGSISIPKNEDGASYAIYDNKKITLYSIDKEEKIDEVYLG